jgi:hypothetical protein
MKNSALYLSFALAVVVVLTTTVFGQTPPSQSAENVLFAELHLPDLKEGHSNYTLQVPNGFNFSKSSLGGVLATVDCTNCPLSAEYSFYVYEATRLSRNRTSIRFEVYFENASKCNSNKRLVVRNDKKEEIRLKCGVRVYTYYAPPKPKSGFLENMIGTTPDLLSGIYPGAARALFDPAQ